MVLRAAFKQSFWVLAKKKKGEVFFFLLLSKRSFSTACIFGMLYFKLEPDSIYCVPTCDTQI